MRAGYEADLKATLRFLRTPRTAAQVAENFRISRFAAYERLNELANRGIVVQSGIEERVRTGPKAALWHST